MSGIKEILDRIDDSDRADDIIYGSVTKALKTELSDESYHEQLELIDTMDNEEKADELLELLAQKRLGNSNSSVGNGQVEANGASVEKRVGEYCPQCGYATPLDEKVDTKVSGTVNALEARLAAKVDALGEKLQTQMPLGEVHEKRPKEIKDASSESLGFAIGAGLLKAAGLFTLVNVFAPDNYQVVANAGAAIYLMGALSGRFSYQSNQDETRSLIKSIKDRLNAYHPKERKE